MKQIVGLVVLAIALVSGTFSNLHAQTLRQLPALQAPPVQLPGVSAPTAPGPYYALPSWDQKLPSNNRFIILSDWGNAAVLDKETGLVWERSPILNPIGSQLSFAHAWCRKLATGNRKGWRIPMLEELASLLDMSVPSSPKLPAGHPFVNVQPALYLSDSFFSDGREKVDFDTGNIVHGPPPHPDTKIWLWCVRGPGSGGAK